MKLLVSVIVLAILAAGVWVTRSGDDANTINDGVEAEAVTTESTGQSGEAVETGGQPVSEAAMTSDDVVETDAGSVVAEDPEAGLEDSATESPFATVGDSQITVEAQTSEPTSSEDTEIQNSAAEAVEAGSDSGLERKRVVVPRSYPVTDAAKYFIPKEERGPGNLGGPPPLDFPGGPSDPNREDAGATFAPPAAPGN